MRRIEVLQRIPQLRDVLPRKNRTYVEIPRDEGRPVQDPREATDDDEIDLSFAESLYQMMKLLSHGFSDPPVPSRA